MLKTNDEGRNYLIFEEVTTRRIQIPKHIAESGLIGAAEFFDCLILTDFDSDVLSCENRVIEIQGAEAPKPKSDRYMFVCEKCGGGNIQALDWVMVNTDEVVGSYEASGDGDRWCEDCEDHTVQVLADDYEPEEKEK